MASSIVNDAVRHSPLSENSKIIDDKDAISAKTKKLSALLYQTYGEGGEVLRRQSDEVQDNYMWACSDLAREVVDALERLSQLERTTKEVQHG